MLVFAKPCENLKHLTTHKPLQTTFKMVGSLSIKPQMWVARQLIALFACEMPRMFRFQASKTQHQQYITWCAVHAGHRFMYLTWLKSMSAQQRCLSTARLHWHPKPAHILRHIH